ncbi:MAG TPA: hypothetical protein VGJ16_08800, partial [Pirellulales bacterium]
MEKLMLTKPCLIIATLTAIAFAPLAARADDSALLNLLVRKHIITEKEAHEVRSELKAEQEKAPPVTASTSSSTKLKLSTPITEIELYGDARV